MQGDCPNCSTVLATLRRIEYALKWLKDREAERSEREAAEPKMPPRLERITPVQLETIRAIKTHWHLYHVGPRMEDIGRRLGITKQAAAERVKHLVALGFATREARLPRSVRVLYDPDAQGVA